MPSPKITDRDIRVVHSVYKYKYLSASQIQRLHFPSETTRNRRLRRITDEGLIESFQILNIAERIFRLATDGARLVASRLGVEPDDLLWTRSLKKPKDYYFMRHLIKLNDVRIVLEKATHDGPVELRGFIPEYYGKKERAGTVSKYVRDMTFDIANPHEELPHTPDAVFCLEKNGRPALFFLEVDRGTETLSNPQKGVLKMIRFYLSYLAQDGYAGYSEDFKTDEPFDSFRALIVTNSRKRAENMRSAASSLPQKLHQGLRAIWCTTFEDVTPATIFDPIWRPLSTDDKQRYQIA
jgi:DNA-binding Lrp family transcriptional regulator